MRLTFTPEEIKLAIGEHALDLLSASHFNMGDLKVVLHGDKATVFVNEEPAELAELEQEAEAVSTEAQTNEPTNQPQRRRRRTRAEIEADEAEEAAKKAAAEAGDQAESGNSPLDKLKAGDVVEPTPITSAEAAKLSEPAQAEVAGETSQSEAEADPSEPAESTVAVEEPEAEQAADEPEVAAEAPAVKPAGVSLFANLRRPNNG